MNKDNKDHHSISLGMNDPVRLEELPKEDNEQTIKEVLQERGDRYGDFKDHAQLCQALKATMYSGQSWMDCTDSQKQALEVIADKIARMLNGDPHYKDNWVDIIGYSQLVLNQLNKA